MDLSGGPIVIQRCYFGESIAVEVAGYHPTAHTWHVVGTGVVIAGPPTGFAFVNEKARVGRRVLSLARVPKNAKQAERKNADEHKTNLLHGVASLKD